MGICRPSERSTRSSAINLPTYNMGTFWFIYIFYAPVVLVAHLLIFLALSKAKSWQTR